MALLGVLIDVVLHAGLGEVLAVELVDYELAAPGLPEFACHEVLVLLAVHADGEVRRAVGEGIGADVRYLVGTQRLVMVDALGGVLHNLQLLQVRAVQEGLLVDEHLQLVVLVVEVGIAVDEAHVLQRRAGAESARRDADEVRVAIPVAHQVVHDVGGVAVHVVALEVPDGHRGLALFAVYREDHVGIVVTVLECPAGIVLVQPLVADVEVVVVARQPDVLRSEDVVVILRLGADRVVIYGKDGARYVLNHVPAALRTGVADEGAVRLLPVTEHRHVSLGDDMRTRRIPVLAVDGDQRLLHDGDRAARRHSHVAEQLLALRTQQYWITNLLGEVAVSEHGLRIFGGKYASAIDRISSKGTAEIAIATL